jgi:hypothetical protein
MVWSLLPDKPFFQSRWNPNEEMPTFEITNKAFPDILLLPILEPALRLEKYIGGT